MPQKLDGGILESFSRLFGSNVKLYVYPMLDPQTKKVITCNDFTPASHLRHLYQYFMENDQIVNIPDAKIENLSIVSDDVLKMIQGNKNGWEKMVPNRVAEAIKKDHLFGFPYERLSRTSDLTA